MNFATLTAKLDRITNLDEVEDMTEHQVWAKLGKKYLIVDDVQFDSEGDIIIQLEDEDA